MSPGEVLDISSTQMLKGTGMSFEVGGGGSDSSVQPGSDPVWLSCVCYRWPWMTVGGHAGEDTT